jgi:hypothetical protein
MQEFNIKLRNNSIKVNLKDLKTDYIKIKFKVKGLYKNLKFKAEVNFIVYIVNNKFEIHKLCICNLDICNILSSDFVCNNIYTSSICDIIKNEDYIKKIYNQLKYFINSIEINKDNNQINSIVFNSVNNKIKKINIRGYARKYYS